MNPKKLLKLILCLYCAWLLILRASIVFAAAPAGLSFTAEPGVERAIMFLENQISLNPRNLESRLLLGDLYYWNGDAAKALEQWEMCLEDNILAPMARERMGSLGEFSQWIKTIQNTLCSINAGTPMTPEIKATAREILSWSRSFLERSPAGKMQLRVRYLAGWLNLILGSESEAVQMFQVVEMSDPVLGPWAALHRAEILERQGKAAAARELYLRAAVTAPNTFLALQAGYAELMLRPQTNIPIELADMEKLLNQDVSCAFCDKLITILLLDSDPAWNRSGINAAMGKISNAGLDPKIKSRLIILLDDSERNNPALNAFMDSLREQALVEAMLDAGLYTRARDRLKQVSAYIGGISPAWVSIRLADAVFGMGQSSDAIKKLKEIISSSKGDLWAREARVRLGYFLRRQGKDDMALEQFNAVGRPFDSPGCRARYEIGRLFLLQDNNAGMVKAFGDYAAHCPDGDNRFKALGYLARRLYIDGNWTGAMNAFSMLEQEFKTGSDRDLPAYWIAACLEHLGRTAEAEQYLQNIIRDMPYTFYGYIAASRLGIDPVPIWKQAVESQPAPVESDDISRQARAELISIGLITEAQSEAEYRVALNPDSVEARIDLARILGIRGDYMASIAAVEEVWKRGLVARVPTRRRMEYWELSFPRYYLAEAIDASKAWGQDTSVIFAVIRQESRFQPNAVSSSNAMGLMQIISSTAKFIAKKISMGNFSMDRLFDPKTNMYMGTWYLRHLSAKFNGNMSLYLAAYNGGPGNVSKWVRSFGASPMMEFIIRIPKEETRKYVQRVLLNYWEYMRLETGR